MAAELMTQICAPALALGVGGALLLTERTRLLGKVIFYFGAQTGMSLYMKAVLSSSVVSEELGLRGFPAAFVVTGLQQLTALIFFTLWVLVSRFTPWKYSPKRLTSTREWVIVIVFSMAFTANIALNNFSVQLLPVSVNLTLRSCVPMPTFLLQQTAGWLIGSMAKDGRFMEVALMLAGVVCAAVAVVAKAGAPIADDDQASNEFLGVVVCCMSVFAASVNMVLAGILGNVLNSVDTTAYMSLPAVLLLLPPSFLMSHPVGWPVHKPMTDWEVFVKVLALSPSTVGLAFLSGIFAFGYNVFQYNIVQTLSATHATLAGNFNKAATIVLALLVGLDCLPEGTRGLAMLAGTLGNIGTFTAYNLSKMSHREDARGAHGGEANAEEAILLAEEMGKPAGGSTLSSTAPEVIADGRTPN